MGERVRLALTVVYWCVCACLGMAAFHWWDHEPWRQVALFPVVMAFAGTFTELRRRRRGKRSVPQPPPPPL
jgi:hypothetical protein